MKNTLKFLAVFCSLISLNQSFAGPNTGSEHKKCSMTEYKAARELLKSCIQHGPFGSQSDEIVQSNRAEGLNGEEIIYLNSKYASSIAQCDETTGKFVLIYIEVMTFKYVKKIFSGILRTEDDCSNL